MRRLVTLVALAGCDQVFGLDRPDPDAPGAGELRVIGHHGVQVIEPDGLGGYLPGRDQALPTEVSVVLDDGTAPAVTIADDLSFSFPVAFEGQGYRLRYTPYAAAAPLTFVGSASEVFLFAPLFGRLERDPIPAGTRLTVNVPPTIQQALTFSTGLRTQALANQTPTLLITFTLDWSMVASLSGPAGLPSAAAHDTFYFADYRLVGGVGAYFAIDHIGSKPLTLQGGTTTTLTLSTQSPALGRCVRLTAGRAAEQTRLAAALAMPATTVSAWAIEATPNPTVSPLGGILLAYENTTASSDFTEDVAYANPLLGERQVVRLAASAQQTVSAGIFVTAITEHWAPLPVTTMCDAESAVTIGGTVAIATRIEIDGQLAQGDVTITDGRVTFDAIGGAEDFHIVEVVESDGTTVVASYLTADRAVTLDAGQLQPRSSYLLRVVTYQGYPDGRIGDTRTVAYPVGRSSVYSSLFRVR
jgi:hypothetical protein